MYLRDYGYTLPSGAILLSPWVGEYAAVFLSSIIIHQFFVDLTMSCESWDSNAPYDVVPFPTADNHMNPIALYLGENIEMYLTHPYASPLFGDFKDLPPLLIQAGDAEVLRDEIILLAHKATLAGVQVRHELYEDAVSFLYLFVLPVSHLAIIRSIYFRHIHFLMLHVILSSRCAISCTRCCHNVKVDHHKCLA